MHKMNSVFEKKKSFLLSNMRSATAKPKAIEINQFANKNKSKSAMKTKHTYNFTH